MISRQRSLPSAAWLIPFAVLLAYANTFSAPFVFDDVGSIVENPTIRKLWPLTAVLSPPPDHGLTVSGRPLLNLTLALNYAISGLEVWSYHALNLLIHLLAALALFGVVRRTLVHPILNQRFGSRASILAALIAAAWALHPLQTESLTYIVQRAESLMGLFFLLTLYAFIRAFDSARPTRWWVLSCIACLFCAATKEIAAVAPIMVFLYDRTFLSGTFRAAWHRHRWVHVALLLTWIPLASLLLSTGGNRGGTVGFDVGTSWIGYWLTQVEAITRYLGLALWPHPLVFDYGKIAAPGGSAALLWSVPVVTLALATLIALRRWPVWGFLGAWFFGILAPTSIVPGALQMIVEHRMYLPLAAVVAAVVCTAARWFNYRMLLLPSFALMLAAATLTFQRNRTYRSEEVLWLDTLAKCPENARAHNNLGRVYSFASRFGEAIPLLEKSLRLDPSVAQTHFNLGLALLQVGRAADALTPLRTAIVILPDYSDAHLNLGNALVSLGFAAEALPHYANAVRREPKPAEAYFRRGVALAQLGRWREAIEDYAKSLAHDPSYAQAQSNWGVALLEVGAVPEAIEHFNAALNLKPDLPDVHYNLGLAWTARGRGAEAVRHYREAVRLKPDHVTAQLNLGIALAQGGDVSYALPHLREAVRLRPDLAEAHINLGTALGLAGRTAEALEHYQIALRHNPEDAQANYNVGYTLAELQRWREARAYLEKALLIQPNLQVAREILQRLPR